MDNIGDCYWLMLWGVENTWLHDMMVDDRCKGFGMRLMNMLSLEGLNGLDAH